MFTKFPIPSGNIKHLLLPQTVVQGYVLLIIGIISIKSETLNVFIQFTYHYVMNNNSDHLIIMQIYGTSSTANVTQFPMLPTK